LFNLLIGLLKPTSGTIRIDGIPLSSDNCRLWLKRIGYVPQEVFIFNGTISENIALGCKQIDKERIKEILGKVSLDKWAASLPNGLDTVLGEAGGKLSGGQKQRIGIARALYKQADVLFLDEATSALDNQTEKEVNETLSQLMESYEGLTILSIAHRESSLRYCDRIITLEDRE
jgi:ABC-type multidrug transport system fused ATPase/permease subunit